MKRILFCLLAIGLFSCDKKSVEPAQDTDMDAVIADAMDSIYDNTSYARTILTDAMRDATDSLDYYRALQTYGMTFLVAGVNDTAKLISEQVVSFLLKEKTSEEGQILLSTSYNCIGNCYANLRKQDSALYFYEKALSSYRVTGKRDKLPDLYINIGDMHMKSGDLAQSAFYYRSALSVVDSLEMQDKLELPIYMGLARLYMDMRDFELSDYYLRLAEERYQQGTLHEQFGFCNLRGNYYFFTENYEEALQWFRKGKALLVPGGYLFHINLLHGNMGEVFYHLNQPDSAHFYLDAAYDYFSEIDQQPLIYHIKSVKAALALKENDTELAGYYLRDEGRVSESEIEPVLVSLRNSYMQDYYARRGDFKEAYAYLLRNDALDDSIRSDRVSMRIADIDMRYSLDTTLLKSEMMIQGQALDIKSLRWRNMMLVTACLLFVAIGFIYYTISKKQKEQQLLDFNQEITRLRMLNIRNRISPHFIFNILNREISSERESIRTNLTGLVLLLRRSLEMTDRTQITLGEELEFVKSFIGLEQESLGPAFTLEWIIESDVDIHSVMLPSMIIQIPVENAIKHGLRSLPGEKRLSLQVKKEGTGTTILITDNGPGYRSEQVVSSVGTGTGLKVLYQTIDLLNSMNRDKIVFHIADAGEESRRTQVSIFIPDYFVFQAQRVTSKHT